MYGHIVSDIFNLLNTNITINSVHNYAQTPRSLWSNANRASFISNIL